MQKNGGKGGKMTNKGKVFIVGAGPGDYKLMTIKAAECISKADVIVYDRLVNTKILGLAREDAEFVYVGKMPECLTVPQERINEIIARKALEGKTVARVKGGDPFVFGRGGEEAEALHDKGIDFEIVPGVTSATAVPAYAGIPVTHRYYSSSLHIITGHERPDRAESAVDYRLLSRLEGTLVFLMGTRNLPGITAGLIENGKNPDTPAAVIYKGTTGQQKVVTGTVKNISERVSEERITSPAVIVIGQVAGLRDRLDWFKPGPLSGKRILVTRAMAQSGRLAEAIEELGGEAVEFPTIKISEPATFESLDEAINSIETFKWLVFTSTNGVKAFFGRMKILGKDIRSLWGTSICAIGDATAEELRGMGLNVDFIPDRFVTSALLEGLLARVGKGEKVLLARSELGSRELSDGLKEHNIDFVDLVVYRTLPDCTNREFIMDQIRNGEFDFVTFTSSSTVINFVSAIGKENIGKFKNAKIVCIGPVTAATAEKSG